MNKKAYEVMVDAMLKHNFCQMVDELTIDQKSRLSQILAEFKAEVDNE